MPLAADAMVGMAMRFSVTIDEGKYDLGSWSKVDGLTVTWDLCEYRAGDGGNERWYYPGPTDYPNIRLSRAVSEETAKVREWLSTTSFGVEYYSGRIALLDAKGDDVTDWTLNHIMPVKWSISPFDASQSKVAIETLDLAHMGFLEDE